MLEYFFKWVRESWNLFEEMSIWLLLGFVMAGFFHVFISKQFVIRHLSASGFKSVLKAAFIGVPLPLCSCGVIPVAAELKKRGASRASTLSFLTSTPSTGVDSILATYALLGPFFAILRPVFALVLGLVAGCFTSKSTDLPSDEVREVHNPNSSLLTKLKSAISYGLVDLIDDLRKWLIIGVLVGGAISAFIPQEFFEDPRVQQYSYLSVFLIAIPLYVCATSSIPIAASLVLKGLSPGAAFIFLTVGPATNTATLSFILGSMGKKVAAVYVMSIAACSFGFAYVLDTFFLELMHSSFKSFGHEHYNPWWYTLSGAILLVLMVQKYIYKKKIEQEPEVVKCDPSVCRVLEVSSMTCMGCVRSIEKILSKVKGLDRYDVQLTKKRVLLWGDFVEDDVIAPLVQQNYQCEWEVDPEKK